MSDKTRMERDSMGEMQVPADALYGATTARAILNFPISGITFSRPFIRALGLVKVAAAQVNHDLGLLSREKATLIEEAGREVINGLWDDQFPIDIFQTGSGTSTNMNGNEVIASRAQQIQGERLVHPNDDAMTIGSQSVFTFAVRNIAMRDHTGLPKQ